ncbi:MAG: HD domain-containing protein [Clostridiaceae bacterium]|nr:HD domain-containing protein [Clostridiaceae bacterium]
MKDEDVNFINIYLDEFEKDIFLKLKKNEQKHSVRVAMLAILISKEKKEYKNISLDRIIRAGLLHDIGKSLKKINVVQKVFMVLANKMFGKRLREMDRFEFVDSYYNHAELSYSMLEHHIKDNKLLYLIRNHHSSIKGDIELDLLRYCDNRN